MEAEDGLEIFAAAAVAPLALALPELLPGLIVAADAATCVVNEDADADADAAETVGTDDPPIFKDAPF